MLVYQHGRLERTARTSALHVRQRSVGLKDVSPPERLPHLNMRDNKAGQKQGISAVSVATRWWKGKVRCRFLWMHDPIFIKRQPSFLGKLGWPFW